MKGITLERNVVKKDHRKVRLRFALAYPSPYSVGMSNLAVRLLYELINDREDCLCERFFFSGFRTPPLSLESNLPLGVFDVVGFSLQHEIDYVRMLDMLDSSSIELFAYRRKRPVVIAGGPAISSNPSPLEDFVDLFVVGESEPVLDHLLDGLSEGRDPRQLAGCLPGLYVSGIEAERGRVESLEDAPHAVRQVHPVSGQGFSSTFLLEVSRGCNRGCRFCLECYLYRPKRERSFKRVREILEQGLPLSGLDRVTCISSAFFDHREIADILAWMRDRHIRYSLPSVRISRTSGDVAELLAAGGQRSITIAPESPSSRLREVINKPLDESEMMGLLEESCRAGIRSLKLYFMVGIPGEGMPDLELLKPMLSGVISTGFDPRSIHVSINPMIPKGNTPFQWARMVSEPEYRSRVSRARKICSELGIRRFESMDYRWGAVQAFLSTSGRGASSVLLLALKDISEGGQGDLGTWRRVLKGMGKNFETIQPVYSEEDPLPWELIKGGPSRSLLLHEYLRAIGGQK
ncbi:MAG: radical SAM protein [Candidatus Verstraetearchaeota archaeon]|nr:radical SAM protein [Candidatus Verstraetearchaeota archaeon]